MSERWFYRLFGEEFGPVSLDELHQIVQTGLISAEDEVRSETASQWQNADRIPELDSDASDSSSRAAPPSPTDEWFCRIDALELGPLQFAVLEIFAKSGQLTVDDVVKHGINGNWWKAGLLIRLTALMPSAPDQRETPAPADRAPPTSAKRPKKQRRASPPSPVSKPTTPRPIVEAAKSEEKAFSPLVNPTPIPPAVAVTPIPDAAPIAPVQVPVRHLIQDDVKTSSPETFRDEWNRPSTATNKPDVAANVANITSTPPVRPIARPMWTPPKEKWHVKDGLPILQRLFTAARESESFPKLGGAMAVLALVWFLSWLFSPGESGPQLFKATGLVTFNDKPLPNASVIFNPTSALTPSAKQSGKLATGRTDQSGRFVLYTDQRAGALPADYTVMIIATEEVPAAAQPQRDLLQRPPELKPGERPTLPKPPKSLIPERYTTCKESGLSFPVSDTKGNYFDIKLTGEPPAKQTP